MEYRTITRIIGLLVALFSTTMLPPALIAVIYKDGGGTTFVQAFVLSLVLGLLLWYPNRDAKQELRSREGFLIVVLFWTVLGSIGAIPLVLADSPNLSFTDAMFEAFSALTTTGATVITGLDNLPKAILFYRHLLQWLGGMGIIVLAVAVLPMLGVGGMQLYRCETPGPVKDNKMTPRIAETAKALWYIYLTLTIACALAYWLAGMNLFDAVGHAFSTVSIGGFSSYDASMGHFDSRLINAICVVFLLIAGVNFSLHFTAFGRRGVNLKTYFRDTEVKVFLGFQLGVTAICFLVLLNSGIYDSPESTLDHAMFQAVSISTTAGFATQSFSEWPLFLPILLILASFVGGCAGSTGGGMKVVRIVLLLKQGGREVKRLIHPRAMYAIRLNNKAVGDRVIDAVWGFFAAYAGLFALFMVALIATGMDDITAFSATVACLNNLGPGLGAVASHFGDITDTAKWLLVLAMLFGRLEIFTLLVLFSPAFWKS
ncbi:TrkH family potassium uptake protein [Ferrimonas balearica]|uniref:TrkH family potassium uptake protein n=1 Tax=Ferrimonas balearica TaxID=44012 RepID=UPI001C57EA0B|nr:TrkH family potassium uptake protein [Ferrimonas balearica]MBW3141690.1 TrkH family potassium uptake protein [Ferrimonas balearica]MBW3166702.1 TrkH family potassium uptake protein [Ferrimonas balearica]MBY5982422.1 TrkH family potassium uptake protein [Ferrimonas balearica]MBY6108754.1 TrkH family potassium uptake protein [Ferrimonas balearica]MBY6226505.1 TrkH family potassium uptake protein [Ferrimonas balearica]